MELTRRQFFRLGVGATPRAARRPAAAEWLRPPGALAEPEFREACTRCDACVLACPHHAIKKAGGELGADLEGTPVILPKQQPCWLCTDLPCIACCEPQALQPLHHRSDARLATIAVDAASCYSAQGNPCEVCADNCPVPGAIRVPFREVPAVDESRCTGCSACAWLCPADAIQVLQLAQPGACQVS